MNQNTHIPGQIAERQPTLRDWFRYYFVAGEDSPSPGYIPGFVMPGRVKWAVINIMHYIKHPVGLWLRLAKVLGKRKSSMR